MPCFNLSMQKSMYVNHECPFKANNINSDYVWNNLIHIVQSSNSFHNLNAINQIYDLIGLECIYIPSTLIIIVMHEYMLINMP